ncbi:uncharacterized protein LOC116343586 isoform X1 [Contarinia nasturtii]|uniref:uncharacterized protein LOC116343586 isoform X1 n=1 Tax=Contarinia nasturtii TaxID=265458 RepID=UPI0012D4A05F|nr:uncharacterized protein LOC116343586 isoform X1 [Contarinia nasturtii]
MLFFRNLFIFALIVLVAVTLPADAGKKKAKKEAVAASAAESAPVSDDSLADDGPVDSPAEAKVGDELMTEGGDASADVPQQDGAAPKDKKLSKKQAKKEKGPKPRVSKSEKQAQKAAKKDAKKQKKGGK